MYGCFASKQAFFCFIESRRLCSSSASMWQNCIVNIEIAWMIAPGYGLSLPSHRRCSPTKKSLVQKGTNNTLCACVLRSYYMLTKNSCACTVCAKNLAPIDAPFIVTKPLTRKKERNAHKHGDCISHRISFVFRLTIIPCFLPNHTMWVCWKHFVALQFTLQCPLSVLYG